MSQHTPTQAHVDAELILRAFERLLRTDRRAATRLLRVLRGMLRAPEEPPTTAG